MNRWCEILHKEIEELKEMEERGDELSWDHAQKLMIADHACKVMEMNEYWKGYNIKYNNAEYPTEKNHKTCYHCKNNEVDNHINRILDKNSMEHDKKLSEI